MKYSCKITPDGKEMNSRLRGIVNCSGRVFKYSLGHVDSVSGKWDPEKRRCAPGTRHGKKKLPAHVINESISTFENAVDEFFILNEDTPFKPDELRKYINAKFGITSTVNDGSSVFVDYETFIRRSSSEDGWAYTTIQKHRTLISDLRRFTNGSLHYYDINKDFMSRFGAFLIKKGNRNETVNKKLKNFRWFIRWANEKGMCHGVDIDSYRSKLRTTKRPVVFLSYDELQRLYSLKFSSGQKHLERARDFFCFQCYTSLRFSDMAALKKSAVTRDTIHVYQKKTGKYVDIELNEFSRSILEKYRDCPGEYALPVPSMQKVNDYIKEACRMADITEPVTFVKYVGSSRIERTIPKYECVSTHAGRRTFICTALSLGIPVTTVMQWTGHSSYESMRPYVSASTSQKRDFMSMFDRLKEI